jgi:hypothetical protein
VNGPGFNLRERVAVIAWEARNPRFDLDLMMHAEQIHACQSRYCSVHQHQPVTIVAGSPLPLPLQHLSVLMITLQCTPHQLTVAVADLKLLLLVCKASPVLLTFESHLPPCIQPVL